MLNKALSDFVAYTVTTMSDHPQPSAMEILTALNRVADEAHRLGREAGYNEGYAQGVLAGSNHTSSMFDRIFGAP